LLLILASFLPLPSEIVFVEPQILVSFFPLPQIVFVEPLILALGFYFRGQAMRSIESQFKQKLNSNYHNNQQKITRRKTYTSLWFHDPNKSWVIN
jgi:hypothetical protein